MTRNQWTDIDLAVLGELDARGLPVETIATRMGRSRADIEDHVVIVRQRRNVDINPVFAISEGETAAS